MFIKNSSSVLKAAKHHKRARGTQQACLVVFTHQHRAGHVGSCKKLVDMDMEERASLSSYLNISSFSWDQDVLVSLDLQDNEHQLCM